MLEKGINDPYDFLFKLLKTRQENSKNEIENILEKNRFGIEVRDIQTVRAKNPQNEWEGELVPTILIELPDKQKNLFKIYKKHLPNHECLQFGIAQADQHHVEFGLVHVARLF